MPCRRARVLLVAPPAYGHLFPLVPLAWAIRCAGHDVRIASCGVSVNAAARAGLAVVDVARHVDLPALLRRHKAGFTRAFPPSSGEPAADDDPAVFVDLAEVMADGVIEAARTWRADLIVHTPEACAAVVAAARLDIPAVFMGIGLGHTPRLMTRQYERLGRTCERHHVSSLAPPAAWIDLSPPSLRQTPSDGWPMRYVPYNGSQPLPLTSAHGSRRRVAVTLGTMVPLVLGLGALRDIVDAATRFDATFVIAHGADSPCELGPLPVNVEAHSWTALDTLAEGCDAAIHHGGFGTTLTMLSAGVPQWILPQGADQFFTAEVLRHRGVAIAGHGRDAGEAIHAILESPCLRRAAEDVRAEMASMPPPAAVVSALIGLVH